MSPPVTPFPAHQLGHHIRFGPNGKLRKPPVVPEASSGAQSFGSTNSSNGGGTTPLGPYADKQRPWEQCPLYEMSQWNCEPEKGAAGRLVCREVVRMLRRCANGRTIETTALE